MNNRGEENEPRPDMNYIELRAASAFSFLDGASLPETLMSAAANLGFPAAAIMDRDGVYGAPRFHQTARKTGLRAHIGAEVSSELGRVGLLAATREGYRNLCRLITRMKLAAPKGKGSVSAAALEEFSGGLFCLTGGEEGPLTRSIPRGAGRSTLERLAGVYGQDRVYVELQRHFNRDEEAINRRAVELARACGLPLIATNGVRYAEKPDREILDVFTCIRNHRNLETAGRLLAVNSERHLKSASEMARLFRDLPEAIGNTVELSSRLEFTLNDLGYEFPRYPLPDGGSTAAFLRARTEEGALQRFKPYDERSRRQIARELALIEKLGLEGYFLIVWDIVEFCRRENILAQGRGSAANSAVCYALGITAVDPVKMELLFERFLSEERGEWPDIDLDLPSGDERERVIQYVYRRYGERGAAMTANVITYRGRSAAREAGKALGIDPVTLDRVARLMSHWEYKDPDDTMRAQFTEAGLDLDHPRIRKFLELCSRLQDLPRHLGQHSGGMIVCQGRLDAVVPLEPATMPGRVVTQWDKDDCADMGIIKVDLLGLGMMAALKDSIELIRAHHNEEVDLGHLPANDPAVYSALQKADTVGMFQIESRAQMSCLPRLRPERFYDIVVQVAIIRPGPIVGNMVHPYLKRRRGREPVRYPHPSLEPALKRTLGVPLFQEQLLRIAMVAAGFSGGEAEELRRAFGSKRSERKMREIEVKLRRGMDKNGITGSAQDEIILSITSFAQYGFPESHAASFALIAYASAYLKCHYLDAFTAAILNNQPMGFYSPATLVKDAQRHGLKVKPIDVTRSDWPCTLEDGAVRIGLRYIRGMRESVALALVRERARGAFVSVDDLALRVPELQKREMVQLAQAGALNFLDPERQTHRRDALWQVERACRRAGPLLETTRVAREEVHETAPLERMSPEERVVADFETSGLTTGPHPMAYYRDEMIARRVTRAVDLERTANGARVRVAGAVIARQRPGAAKGFVFLSLEDETGISNIIITPDVFQQHRLTIIQEPFLFVEGRLQRLDGAISVKASRIEPLAVSAASIASHDFH
ncbi:MAG TPA: error-prone DNA polymerase [Terriglobia bacterium]|nr:error-prone DNA polymerase [Terriglobia bacterium]